MAPFSKPETVLRQAEGLISVGQTHAALQSLTEMFASKRFRSTPLPSLEPIMYRFIELCVDMRKGRTAKEGLMQYKNIAQNVNVQSIEAVINRFLQLADAKVRDAQQQAAVQSAVDVDDLEASETPESILLGAVSGDQSKDRTDRALVTPWLKFLWESYRTSLETLKNNARLEAIYQQIAQQAFKFCLKHNRKVEFRRLCETLRLHLTNVAKYSHQQHAINLSDPDTLQHHLDTRFAQLNTSVELELWQEAFRSVEDVHNLLTMAKKAPRPAMMANYYEKLTKIFLMSGNALYHAAAWGRYYAIVMSMGWAGKEGDSDRKAMEKLAGQVLVSALAVPVGLHTEETDELKGKNARLTALLGLTRMPTRAGLLKDALSRDVLKLSPAPIKSLYNILEVTFDPLSLCSSIAPLLSTLATDTNGAYAPYIPLLQRALLSRLLNQLSQVYSTFKIAELVELVEPLRRFTIGTENEKTERSLFEGEQIEAYIMGCARRGELNIRVDHKDGSIRFIDDAFAISSVDETSIVTGTGLARTKSQESSVQPSLTETVHTRLSKMADALRHTIQVTSGPLVQDEQQQNERFKALAAAIESERKALLLRRALVFRRRELLSELSIRKEKEESSRRAEAKRREEEEEARRRLQEARERERKRVQEEMESIRIDQAKQYAQSLVDKGILRAGDVDKLENYDTEGLIGIQVAQLEKEKREMNEKLRIVAKRIDHLERAYRREERPLLAQDYELQQKLDRETFSHIQEERKQQVARAHQEALETKKRLSRMRSDYEEWKTILVEKKGEAYKKKLEAAKKKIESEKAKRKKEVLKAWEEERERREKEEEERRLREEEERRKEEERLAEEERIRREEEERIAKEEEEKRKKEEEAAAARAAREKERQEAMEKARLQLQREQEAEERRRLRRLEEKEREKEREREREREKEKERDKSAFGSLSRSGPPVIRAANGAEPSWRKKEAVASTTVAPASTGVTAPPRSESPASGKYRPGVFGATGGWRAREEAKAAGGGSPTPPSGTPTQRTTGSLGPMQRTGSTGPVQRTASGAGSGRTSPAPGSKEKDKQADDDGFTTVQRSAVWKSKRAQAGAGGGR